MSRRPVLVIDDDSAWCERICRFLEGHGFEVVTAANGSVALELLPAIGQPTAVLLDIASPGTDGPAFCQSFRQLPAYYDVPLFLVTAASPADVFAKRVGVNGYLRKSVALDYLPFLLNELPPGTPQGSADPQDPGVAA